MLLTPLQGAFVLLVSFANFQDPVRTAGDSQAIAAERGRSDSVLAARRQIVDSINAAARRDSSALSRAISRLNQGPFQEHTLAFFGAMSFVGVFMFFGMLSIAFNPLPTLVRRIGSRTRHVRVMCARTHPANAASVMRPDASRFMTSTTSGSGASRSNPFRPRKTYIAWKAARLLPSTNP